MSPFLRCFPPIRLLLLTLAPLTLAACGGGGGGGGTGTAVASPTPAATTTAAAATPVGPSVTSAEFTRNYAVGAIKADSAWAQGASGRGITVAVIDSGMDGTGPDLAGKAAVASTDINTARGQITGPDRHGTYVAGIIASNFNNQGTVGVAFDSTILAIRAESTGGVCGSDSCFLPSDLARSIDYAVANGARVINLSLGTGSGPAGPAVEAALQRAVDAGVIIAAAAGNSSTGAANWPSGYGVDPRYAGSIIAVGSLNQAGVASSFSNVAGAAGGAFLFAPGESVVTDCNGVTCRAVSGTSFAAPQVAGAMALLLQAFPNMSGRAVVDLLWRSGRDLGAAGTDTIYGRGALDLQRAFLPAGSLSVPTVDAGFVAESLSPGTVMGAAFGDAVAASGALRTVGWDYYQRPFATDLGRAYAGPRAALLTPASSGIRQRTQVDLALAGGGRLGIRAGQIDDGVAATSVIFPWMPAEPSREVAIAFTAGRFGLAAWSGKAAGNPYLADNPDPYAALVQADRAVRGQFALGEWALTAEGGAGQRRSPDLLREEPGSTYLRFSGQGQLGPVRSTLTFGRLDEPMGPLGAYLPARSGLNLPSSTTFAAWSGVWPLGDSFALLTEAGLGRTDLHGRFLSLQDAAWSSQWKIALEGDCAALRLRCASLRLTAAQPLRVENGRFLAVLPVAPSDYFGAVGFSERRFGAAPSGRQTDITLSATERTWLNGLLQLDAVTSLQSAHRQDAGPAFGLLATWRADF